MGRLRYAGGKLNMTTPYIGICASDIAVGTTVYVKENGILVEYLVVNQGIPSDSNLYDTSCDGTWLLRKDLCDSTMQWNTSSVNNYKNTSIHSYLNNDFIDLFETKIQNIIKRVKIPFVDGTSTDVVSSGTSGLSCKVFLLSGYEVGQSLSDVSYIPEDGALLGYFISGTGTEAKNKRIAYQNGTASIWWLRSLRTSSGTDVNTVTAVGGKSSNTVTTTYGIRPAFVIPGNVLFDSTTMELKGDVALTPEIQLGTITEGAIVKLNENGVPVEFYVAKHDYESGLNGPGRTLLIRKDAYTTGMWMPFYTSCDSIYADNTLDVWCNTTYKSLFNSYIQSLIGNTTFYYTPNGYVASGNSDVTTLERSIFVLSATEYGYTRTFANVEGSKLPIASILLSCLLNGKSTTQWTRSPRIKNIDDTPGAFWVNTDGSFGSAALDGVKAGYRPCFTLPYNTQFDRSTLVIKEVS